MSPRKIVCPKEPHGCNCPPCVAGREFDCNCSGKYSFDGMVRDDMICKSCKRVDMGASVDRFSKALTLARTIADKEIRNGNYSSISVMVHTGLASIYDVSWPHAIYDSMLLIGLERNFEYVGGKFEALAPGIVLCDFTRDGELPGSRYWLFLANRNAAGAFELHSILPEGEQVTAHFQMIEKSEQHANWGCSVALHLYKHRSSNPSRGCVMIESDRWAKMEKWFDKWLPPQEDSL